MHSQDEHALLPGPVLVAIGANLPGADGATALATCRAAAEELRGLPGLRWLAGSRWYVSSPMPRSDQPDYINGVVRLEGATDPAVLLGRLHAIEAAAGRVRAGVNGARTLDLDIIAIGQAIRDAPDPVLPHPRAHLRPFVLAPLAEIAPEWRHPRLHLGAAELLVALPSGSDGAILRVL